MGIYSALMTKIENQKACTQRCYEVTRADLPLSCPMPGLRLWDAHPRVYLPVEATGRVICPYCDAEFVLKDE
jgi:uncharacterized Zn-finger protein